MLFSPFDLKNERLIWQYPPHLIDVATLPCESQNTRNAYEHKFSFNVNYEIAAKCIKLHLRFHKCSDESYYNTHFTGCVLNVRHQHANMISDSCATGQSQSITSNQLCVQRFRRLWMPRIFVSFTHCCVTPKISKYKAHDLGPFRWSYDKFYAIFFGNIPQ